MKTSGLLLAALVAIGCSDGSGQGNSGDYCEIICQDEQICEQGSEPPFDMDHCLTDCQEGYNSMQELYDPKFMDGTASCLAAEGCTPEDPCQLEGIEAASPNFQNDPHFQQCMQLHGECSSTDYAFADENCYFMFALLESLRRQMFECLSGGCEAFATCLE